jgi:hypothetical protein
MRRAKRAGHRGRFLLGLLAGIGEFAGIQVAIITPNITLGLPLFFLWVLGQEVLSVSLLFYAGRVVLSRKGEASRLFTIALLCIVMQCLTILQSFQYFGGFAAIADGFLLYLMHLSSQTSPAQHVSSPGDSARNNAP